MLLGPSVDKAGENNVYTNLAQNSSVPLLGFQILCNITWFIVAVGLCLSIISPLKSEKFDVYNHTSLLKWLSLSSSFGGGDIGLPFPIL